MGYIDLVADADVLGLNSAVTQPRIDAASAMIDAYLRRPEGLVFVRDAEGRPSYMAGLKPSGVWVLGNDIQPGENVVCNVSGLRADDLGDLMSEVVVIDRGTDNMEACYVSGYQNGQITLADVRFPHAATAKMERGMTILEERKLPRMRPQTQVRRPQCAQILSIAGRYGLPRHSELINGDFQTSSPMLVNLSVFGPPPWMPVNVTQATIDTTTGNVWIPASIMLINYTDVRLRYVAGWAIDEMPDAIRIATARIANAMAASDDALRYGAVTDVKAGDHSLRRAPSRVGGGNPRTGGADSPYMTPEVRAMIDPYRVRAFA